jgi:MoxR-like ATPase
MLKVVVTYPKFEEERLIMRQNNNLEQPSVNAVVKPEDIIRARNLVKDVYMDEKIEKYILDIVFSSRFPQQYKLEKLSSLIAYGGSPRATICLATAARAYAFIRRRGYVVPEDVRAVCADVLRHRIGLTYEADAEGVSTEDIVNEILNTVEVP